MGDLKLAIFILVGKNRLWHIFSVAVFGAWIRWNWTKLCKGVKLHNSHRLSVEDRGLSLEGDPTHHVCACMLPACTHTQRHVHSYTDTLFAKKKNHYWHQESITSIEVPSPPKKKKMLKNISVIDMKSICLVCFTVELNSETLYIFNILSKCERVVFLDMNRFQILKWRKTNKNQKPR